MKRYLSILMTLILTMGIVLSNLACIFAQSNSNRVIDGAGLLSSFEEQDLEEDLAKWCDEHQFDIVIVTNENNMTDAQVQAYADNFFDYNGYGYGENYDGCVLVVDMASRYVHIGTSGYAATVITDYGIDRILDDVIEYLSDDDPYGAFADGFFGDVKWMYGSAEDGEPYDEWSPSSSDPAAWGGLFGIALIPGAISGLIAARIQKGKLKTIRRRTEAQNYVRRGSLNMYRHHDVFRYSNVTRTPRPKDDEHRSGGSTMHTSSSGRSHGGGGRHF